MLTFLIHLKHFMQEALLLFMNHWLLLLLLHVWQAAAGLLLYSLMAALAGDADVGLLEDAPVLGALEDGGLI